MFGGGGEEGVVIVIAEWLTQITNIPLMPHERQLSIHKTNYSVAMYTVCTHNHAVVPHIHIHIQAYIHTYIHTYIHSYRDVGTVLALYV